MPIILSALNLTQRFQILTKIRALGLNVGSVAFVVHKVAICIVLALIRNIHRL